MVRYKATKAGLCWSTVTLYITERIYGYQYAFNYIPYKDNALMSFCCFWHVYQII